MPQNYNNYMAEQVIWSNKIHKRTNSNYSFAVLYSLLICVDNNTVSYVI